MPWRLFKLSTCQRQQIHRCFGNVFVRKTPEGVAFLLLVRNNIQRFAGQCLESCVTPLSVGSAHEETLAARHTRDRRSFDILHLGLEADLQCTNDRSIAPSMSCRHRCDLAD